MTVVRKEIKTHYTIHITEKDFLAITNQYLFKTEDIYRDLYPKAFKGSHLIDDTKIIEFMKSWITTANGDLLSYIADCFGFDGWENSGVYDPTKKCIRMVVYSWGCDE